MISTHARSMYLYICSTSCSETRSHAENGPTWYPSSLVLQLKPMRCMRIELMSAEAGSSLTI